MAGAAAEGAGGFGVNPLNMARVAGASESAVVRSLYLAQAGSRSFGLKLFAANVLSSPVLLVGGRWRWVTRSAVMEQLLTNATFECVPLLAFDRIAGRFFFQHPESLTWLSRGTAQHELLHLGQFIRSPNVWQAWPWRYVHEYIPSLLGPLVPNSAVVIGGTAFGAFFFSQVYLAVRDSFEAFLRQWSLENQPRR